MTEPDAVPIKPAMTSAGNAPKEWIRLGFYVALGAVLLCVLALIAHELFEGILKVAAPFAIGGILALLLDPLVDRVERWRLKRWKPNRTAATGLVFAAFLLVLIAIGSYAIPALVGQITQLARNGPGYIQNIQDYVGAFLSHHKKIGPLTLPSSVNVLSAQISAKISATVQQSADKILGLLVGSVGLLIDFVLTLIITFFLLVDLDRLRARLVYLVPSRHRSLMELLASDVGGVFSDYLRGLLIVCALYGLCTLFLLYGLSIKHHAIAGYALLVAVSAGLLYAVPYLGALVIALVTFLVAFAAGGIAFGGWAILLTIILNQVFDNVITPRVVGGGVGLHPVAAIFALTLGGTLFGVSGMLLSVPVAASIQVILFRLFPKLKSPTPPEFLERKGVHLAETKSEEVLKKGG